MNFANLRTFSCFSLSESIVPLKDLMDYSKQKGLKFVAICDRMNMFAVVEFSSYAVKAKLKPIIGCLVKVDGFGYLPIFTKNEEGYKTLCYVLSQAYIRNDDKIYFEDLKRLSGNVVVLTGSEDSIFYQTEDYKEIIKKLNLLNELFYNDLYVEIQAIKGRKNLIKASFELNLPIVVTSNVFFTTPDKAEYLYVSHKIRDNEKYSQDEFESFKFKNNFLKSQEEIVKEFMELDPDAQDYLEEAIENTYHVIQKCNYYVKASNPILPTFCENEGEELDKQARVGLEKKLETIPKEKHEQYWKRLEYELSVIIKKNFAGYFLITSDFIKYAKSQKICVGMGRGSGSGSLLAYVLDITGIDPIQYDLIFERFLNPERNSMPDFDIDFEPDRRIEVIQYIKSKYGEYNVANITTFGKLQARGAFRDVARVFRIPFFESDEITKLIPQDQVHKIDLQEAINVVPKLKELSKSERFSKIFSIALQLEGIPKNLSKHAAGIVICDKPVYNYCPIYKDENGDLVTQFDLKSAEIVGCVKFDFLGLRTLSIIQKSIDMVNKNYMMNLKWEDIPLDDKKTFELIGNLNMEGIFQFESPGVKEAINSMQPDCLEDLIALNALYRPGPIKMIPVYIKRKKGEEPVEYPHPLSEPVLKNTYGIIIYQEQVMDIARVLAGYTLAEADLLRRAMGKKQHEEMIAQRTRFCDGCKKNNIEERIATGIFDLMEEFSGYAFNKAHAATYGLIAYLCAYLKANYPLEFFSVCLSLELDDDEKVIKYIYSLRQMGIKLLRPNVKRSGEGFEIEGGAIRFGIKAIKNVGKALAESIVKENEKKTYEDIFDFSSRNHLHLNKRSWEYLVKSGSLDCFGLRRKDIINALESILKGEEIHFEENDDIFENFLMEKEAFGFFVFNPLEIIRPDLRELHCFPTTTLSYGTNQTAVIAGEIVEVKRKRNLQSGKNYAFIELADERGIVDITIFSTLLEKETDKIKKGELVVCEVSVERIGNFCKLVGRKIALLDEFLQMNSSSEIVVEINSYEEIESLKKIIEKYPGEKEVRVITDVEELVLPVGVKDSLHVRLAIRNATFS